MIQDAIINVFWDEFIKPSAYRKYIDMADYPPMDFPDKKLYITEVFDISQLNLISERCQEIIGNNEIAPIFSTLGDNMICIGIGEQNRGFVYYHDMDFGLFQLCENLTDFIQKLKSDGFIESISSNRTS